MKKIISCLLTVLMVSSVLTGCGGQHETDTQEKSETITEDTEKINIVATIFPQYDWVRQILGGETDRAELTLLVDNGLDLHNFQPSAENIVTISNCDMFIYVGGESDEWVEDALKTAVNEDMIIINLLEVLGDEVKEEEIKEGMDEDEDDHDDGHDEAELDEHVWLSLKNAQTLCSHIAAQIGEIDREHAKEYQSNADAYNEKLKALDEEYQAAVNAGETNVLLFGDRFPFRYLVDDYDMDYYAAFPGCSAETEASFETIAFLAGKMDELQLRNIMVVETSDQSIADTIVQNTADKDQKVRVLNSMQSVTAADVEAGTTYLTIMESNLEVLKEAVK